MKRTVFTSGAGYMFMNVAGHDDPLKINLDNVEITISEDNTLIRNDIMKSPTSVKFGDRTVKIKATIPTIIDGQPWWELWGFTQGSNEIIRKVQDNEATVPSSSPFEITITADSGYSYDEDSIVVINNNPDSASYGAQYDRVSTSPGAGEYSLTVTSSDATITFDSSEADNAVLIQAGEYKTVNTYKLKNAIRRCVSIEGVAPILREFGCPAEESQWITFRVERAVPTSDLSIKMTKDSNAVDVEFVALAGPDGNALEISAIED